jgi:ATP-binding cassette subfamily A (ABC1) protein 3
MTYLGSFIFTVPSTGLIRLTLINLLSGTFFFMVYFILNFDMLGLKDWARGFGWLFILFPHYSLSRAFSNTNVKSSLCKATCDFLPVCDKSNICDTIPKCCPGEYYNFEEDGIGKNLVALTIMGFVFFAMIYIKDYRVFEYVQYKIKRMWQ